MVYSVKGTCIHYLLAPSVQHFNASGKESSTNLDQSTCTILSGNRYSTRGFIPKGALLWLGIMVSPTVPDSKDALYAGTPFHLSFFRPASGDSRAIWDGYATDGRLGEKQGRVCVIYTERLSPLLFLQTIR